MGPLYHLSRHLVSHLLSELNLVGPLYLLCLRPVLCLALVSSLGPLYRLCPHRVLVTSLEGLLYLLSRTLVSCLLLGVNWLGRINLSCQRPAMRSALVSLLASLLQFRRLLHPHSQVSSPRVLHQYQPRLERGLEQSRHLHPHSPDSNLRALGRFPQCLEMRLQQARHLRPQSLDLSLRGLHPHQ